MTPSTDCLRCEESSVVETTGAVIVLCRRNVVKTFGRKVRLELQTVTPPAECPRRAG